MERLINNKRGASHFEMIVSFVLFFVFITFLLIFIRPYDSTKLSDSVVAALQDNFRNEVYTNLTTFFVQVGGSGTCFNIPLQDNLFNYDLSQSGSKAFDASTGENVGSYLRANSLSLDLASGSEFFYVRVSPDLEDSTIGACSEPNMIMYGSIDERIIVSEKKILEMVNQYETGYDTLKGKMGLPPVFDFAISSDSFQMTRTIPEEVNVVADDYIVEVLMQDGTIKNMRITFQVW